MWQFDLGLYVMWSCPNISVRSLVWRVHSASCSLLHHPPHTKKKQQNSLNQVQVILWLWFDCMTSPNEAFLTYQKPKKGTKQQIRGHGRLGVCRFARKRSKQAKIREILDWRCWSVVKMYTISTTIRQQANCVIFHKSMFCHKNLSRHPVMQQCAWRFRFC